MKIKLLSLIVAMTAFGQAASPNKTWRCAFNTGCPATVKPATMLMADDAELLPNQFLLNKI